MKKSIFAFIALFLATFSFAQIEGTWKTIDDETGQAKSYVQIFKAKDGKYYGKISKLLIKPENNNCVKCKDDRKDKPILGLEIIRGLSKDENVFDGGTITDPKTGKTYKCSITREADKLNVRGYIGISLMGRSQTWYKVN